jgi:hypothetical protein
VPENASPAEARRAYFLKLRECDFLPPRSLYRALRVLDGSPGADEPNGEWLVEEEARLRADVESFAGEFFTVPVPQRRQRWEALLARSQGVAPLAARVEALKAGLDIQPPSLPTDPPFCGEAASQLLQSQLLQSFPLSLLAQAGSRQTFLGRVETAPAGEEQRKWEKAASYLLAEWPALAALDRELVKQIAQLRSRLKRRRTAYGRSHAEPQKAPVGGGDNRYPWWLLWLFLVPLGGLMRGVKTSNDRPLPQVPSFNYTAPRDGNSIRDLEALRADLGLDPKTGAPMPLISRNSPPFQELLDPSRYDVTLANVTGTRILRFTPRPGSQGNNGQSLYYGETALILWGLSREEMTALFSRAEGKNPDGTPKKPPDDVHPKPPRAPQGDGIRP